MMGFVIYGIGYWLCTLLLQYLLYKIRKNHNHGSNAIWVGNGAIIALCVVGLINHNIRYLAAILGFICANEMGKTMGWH